MILASPLQEIILSKAIFLHPANLADPETVDFQVGPRCKRLRRRDDLAVEIPSSTCLRNCEQRGGFFRTNGELENGVFQNLIVGRISNTRDSFARDFFGYNGFAVSFI